MRKIKIALIGFNEFSHARTIFQSVVKQTDIFEFVGYALPENEREKFPDIIRQLDEYQELTLDQIFDNSEIEAVVIETEEIYLTKYALLAATHKKHIHMEKPGGVCQSEFEKLIEAAKENEVILHIGYMYRYNPFVKQLLKEIQAGELGEIVSVEAQMNCYHPAKVRQWLSAFPGGMLFFLGCHLMDLILQIQGAPMVEGSQIDDYGEYNNLEREMKELYDFDCAVAVAMRYVALHPDTALIVTADHDTGDLEIPADATKEQILSDATYHTEQHTSKTVPVFAVGYGVEALLGVHENTDIGVFTASLLDGREVEPTSQKVTLSKEKQTFTYDEENTGFEIVLSEYAKECKEISQLRTFHIKIDNPTKETLPLPNLVFEYEGETYSVKPQKSWIQVGESVDASYIIPKEAWKKNVLSDISKFILTLNGEQGELTYSSIQIGQYIGQK